MVKKRFNTGKTSMMRHLLLLTLATLLAGLLGMPLLRNMLPTPPTPATETHKVNLPLLSTPAPRRFGVLLGDSRYLASDWQAGIRLREIELQWGRYEPQDGVWDAAYAQAMRGEFDKARAAGYELILDFGLQYPPEWAKELSPWRDQYGNVYKDQINAVWSLAVRARVERYIERVFNDMGTDFYGIRVGSGGWIETVYPANAPGFTHSYWAFDDSAMATNPVPQWRPGDPSPNDEARRFYEWYLNGLIDAVNWQHNVIRRQFNGNILQLFPGLGVRPQGWEPLIAANLKPEGALGVDAAERGAVYDRIVAGITQKERLIIVSTSLGDSSATAPWVDPTSQDPLKWSSAQWIAHIADSYGLPKWAENTGGNDLTTMRTVFGQLDAFDYDALLWAWNWQLYDASHATIGDYERLIREYR